MLEYAKFMGGNSYQQKKEVEDYTRQQERRTNILLYAQIKRYDDLLQRLELIALGSVIALIIVVIIFLIVKI